jgi:aminopeptidase N
MVISLDDFKKLMRDLSILTGKTPTAYGKAPTSQDNLNYMIEVYHREIRNYDHRDIEAAFGDRRLREEIEKSYSLSLSMIEKYVMIYKNSREGKERAMGEEWGKFEAGIPRECKKSLKELGIDLQKIAETN